MTLPDIKNAVDGFVTLYACDQGHLCNSSHIPNEQGVRKCRLCGRVVEPVVAELRSTDA